MYRTKKSEQRYKKAKQLETKCPFCNLEEDRIVSKKSNIYVIKNIYGYDIWDRRKVAEHLLIIPSKHLTSFSEINKKDSLDFMEILMEYSAEGYDIFTRATNSKTKSQPHFHTHLIKPKGKVYSSVSFNADPYLLKFK